MAKKYVTFITAPLTLVYPKFETPDIYVDPTTKVPGKPCYKTEGAEVTPGSMAKMQDYVRSEMVKLFPEMNPETRKVTLPNGDIKTLHWPFKVDKEGTTVLSAKTARISKRTGELLRPAMFDAANNPLPAGVYPGGGTIARLKLTINEMPNKSGVNFYIDQLQVIKLEENSFGKSAFEPTEGYAYDGGDESNEEQQSDFGSGASQADEADALKF
jgi:hypothetical protein